MIGSSPNLVVKNSLISNASPFTYAAFLIYKFPQKGLDFFHLGAEMTASPRIEERKLSEPLRSPVG